MNNLFRQAAGIGSGVIALVAVILMVSDTQQNKHLALSKTGSLSDIVVSTNRLFPAVDSFLEAYDRNLQISDTLGAGVIPFGSRPAKIVASAAPAALTTLFVKGILMQEKPLAIFENAQGVSFICGQGDSIAGMVVKSIHQSQVTVAGPHGVYDIPANQ